MRKFLLGIAAAVVVAFASHADAQDVCPCIPKSPLWTVSACETWNCAQAAMIEANGSPYVVALPTSSKQHRWIVLRRIIGGSVAVPDGPFAIQSFDSLSVASAQYGSVGADLLPMLTSTIDGKFVLLHLLEAEPLSDKPSKRIDKTTP